MQDDKIPFVIAPSITPSVEQLTAVSKYLSSLDYKTANDVCAYNMLVLLSDLAARAIPRDVATEFGFSVAIHLVDSNRTYLARLRGHYEHIQSLLGLETLSVQLTQSSQVH